MGRAIVLVLALFFSAAVGAQAQSESEVQAVVRSLLSQEENIQTLTPEEYEGIVRGLTEKVIQEGLPLETFYPLTDAVKNEIFCESRTCRQFDALGSLVLQYWFVFLGVLAGALFILLRLVHRDHVHLQNTQ